MRETESETFFSNYKEVDGTMVVFDVAIFVDGEEDIVFTVSKVIYNTGLDDSLFEMK